MNTFTPSPDDSADSIRILLAEGRFEEALPVLREACRRWHDLGAPHEVAGTCVRLAEAYRALGDEASAAAEDARAEEAYERLGVPPPGPAIRKGSGSKTQASSFTTFAA